MPMLSRIQAPATARKGEVVTVRILIQHPMENGFRYAEGGTGIRVPYNVVNRLTCRYLEVDVFQATMTSGIAANPLMQFHLLARETGELQFDWVDTSGERGSARHLLTVTA